MALEKFFLQVYPTGSKLEWRAIVTPFEFVSCWSNSKKSIKDPQRSNKNTGCLVTDTIFEEIAGVVYNCHRNTKDKSSVGESQEL